MESSPELAQTLDKLRETLVGRLGAKLVSLTLYGSAARGLFQPGFSDVNLLVVLTEADTAELTELRAGLTGADDHWRLSPYLVTRREWPQVVQAFPTRILEMQRGYQVLLGQDLLKETHVDRQILALRTHQELLNVLLRFRHRLLGSHDSGVLEADLRGCLPAFIKVLRTLVYLRTGVHHDERQEVLREAAAAYGFSEPAFQQLLAWRQGQVVLQGPEWETAATSFLEGMSKVAGAEHG